MQEQIQAIKQLLETNNAIAAVIESILIDSIGEKASWKNSSQIQELEDAANWAEIDPHTVISMLKKLWRSRIVLNDARHQAEAVDLDYFLASISGVNEVLRSSGAASDRLRNLEFSLVEVTEKYNTEDRFEILICALRDAFKEIDRLNTQIADPKSGVNYLNTAEHLEKVVADRERLLVDRDRQIEKLEITIKNHCERFESLKSHFEVTLKAISMNLNTLRGARKPDTTREVDGVMTTFRNYEDNLTHHHKTIIIHGLQVAIAEEAKKLKNTNLKDFSFDDIPF